MRTDDKLYIGEIRIKEPKDPQKWMEDLLRIILDSESHRILQLIIPTFSQNYTLRLAA